MAGPGQESWEEIQRERISKIQDEELRQEKAEEAGIDLGGQTSSSGGNTVVGTDTDLDGETETTGVAVGVTKDELQSGEAEQMQTEETAEAKKSQLNEQQETIRDQANTFERQRIKKIEDKELRQEKAREAGIDLDSTQKYQITDEEGNTETVSADKALDTLEDKERKVEDVIDNAQRNQEIIQGNRLGASQGGSPRAPQGSRSSNAAELFVQRTRTGVPEKKGRVEDFLQARDRNPVLGAATPRFTEALETRAQNLRVENQLSSSIEQVRSAPEGSTVRINTGGDTKTVSRDQALQTLTGQLEDVENVQTENERSLLDPVERNPTSEGAAQAFFNPGTQVSGLQDLSEEAETAGLDLVNQGQRFGSQAASQLQSNRVTQDLGEGAAAQLQSGFEFTDAIESASKGDVRGVIDNTRDSLRGQVISRTSLDELGLIEESPQVDRRTKQVQSAAFGTPADTAGFVTAVGGGSASIVEEEVEQLTSDQERTGEGLKRISTGSVAVAESFTDNPKDQATEEIIQEGTETVLTLGLSPVTPTVTPTNTITKGAKKLGSKAKTATDVAVEKISDPNALGAGAGAFVPEPDTTTPTQTKDTVRIDQEALDTFEVNPLEPETLPSSNTQSSTTTGTTSQTSSLVGPTAQDDVLSSAPEAAVISETRSDVLDNELTGSLSETTTEVDSVTQTDTVTQSLSNTSTHSETLTPSLTNTPTSTPTPESDGEGNNGNEENLILGGRKETVFQSSVGAELIGLTAEETPENFQDPTKLRPIVDEDSV